MQSLLQQEIIRPMELLFEVKSQFAGISDWSSHRLQRPCLWLHASSLCMGTCSQRAIIFLWSVLWLATRGPQVAFILERLPCMEKRCLAIWKPVWNDFHNRPKESGLARQQWLPHRWRTHLNFHYSKHSKTSWFFSTGNAWWNRSTTVGVWLCHFGTSFDLLKEIRSSSWSCSWRYSQFGWQRCIGGAWLCKSASIWGCWCQNHVGRGAGDSATSTPAEAGEQPPVHARSLDGAPGVASSAQASDAGMQQSAEPSV